MLLSHWYVLLSPLSTTELEKNVIILSGWHPQQKYIDPLFLTYNSATCGSDREVNYGVSSPLSSDSPPLHTVAYMASLYRHWNTISDVGNTVGDKWLKWYCV
jgi:hypothetical protein